ncbi:Alpha/Beta hydrolase protein [Spinellus fusiger]|nr:Alpha/Beta hydrolase protein [Spinellus fusiger]
MILAFVRWRYWTLGHKEFDRIVNRNISYHPADPLCTLDVYRPYLNEGQTAPIIVFIYGGSWASGSKYMYSAFANTLRDMGYIVIVPDYRKYPLGHSAGAHLASQIVLEDLVEKVMFSDRTRAHRPAVNEKHDPVKQGSDGYPKHSNDFLPQVEGLILLSGVYNIEMHLQHETYRGLEKISCMARVMGSTVEGYQRNSPIHIISNHSTLFASSSELLDFAPRILFVHGEKDNIVPMEQSVEIYNMLGEVLPPDRRDEVDIRMRLYKRMNHSQCITSFMPSFFGKDRVYESLTRDLQEFIHMPAEEG